VTEEIGALKDAIRRVEWCRTGCATDQEREQEDDNCVAHGGI